MSRLGKPFLARCAIVVLFSGLTAFAQSNVDPANKSAWNENVGWTNWRDAGSSADGVNIGPSYLSGFVWSEELGWMSVGNGAGPYSNVDGASFGVNVAAGGDLSGYAWAENAGWINFGWAAAADPDRPRFDVAASRFRGWAWGETIGWINLDDIDRFVGLLGAGGCTPPDCNNHGQCIDNACVCDPGWVGPDCSIPVDPIPTVSQWGMVTLTLTLLAAGTVVFGRHRPRIGEVR